MRYATATIEGVPSFDSAFSSGDYRRLVRTIGSHLVTAVAALAAVIVLGAVVTTTAAWIVNSTLVTGPNPNVRSFSGPGTLALATSDPVLARTAAISFDAKWAQVSTAAVSLLPLQAEIPQPKRQIAAAPVVKPVAELTPVVPLPRPHPVQIEIAQAPATPVAPQVAPIAAPKAEPPIAVQAAAATPKPPRPVPSRAWPRWNRRINHWACPIPMAAPRSTTFPRAPFTCRTAINWRHIPACSTKWTIRALSTSRCAGRRRRMFTN